MKRINTILKTRVVSLLLLAVSTSALAVAQDHRPALSSLHFTGLINDYTPSNVKGGPYEMHGQWAMDIDAYRSTADFTVDMTMSDYGMTPAGTPDATQGGQGAHTHHIKLTEVQIKWDMTGCPAYSPATTHGFQMSGKVSLITGNGGPAPFEPVPVVSRLQVCVTGGSDVLLSNLSMVFTGPATTHFGPQAIHGVVRTPDVLSR
jgi:hypothetical protein